VDIQRRIYPQTLECGMEQTRTLNKKEQKMTQPTVIITVYKIDDFVAEVTGRLLTKIYRRPSRTGSAYDYWNNLYTAYDPTEKVFIRGSIVFPEVEELNRCDLGRRYSNKWDFGLEAVCEPTSKRLFVRTLRRLGVDKDKVKQFSSVKLDELYKLIDNSDLEDGGESSFTHIKQGGELELILPCDFMGKISQVKVNITKAYDTATYKITIERWDEIYAALCAVHEIPLALAGLSAIDGEIELK
jgi:hypothetical protein